MTSPNVLTVQCRLLTGYLFKGTRNFVRAWDVCNAAMQGAMHVGLNTTANLTITGSLDETIRKKTWLAIVQLHRYRRKRSNTTPC